MRSIQKTFPDSKSGIGILPEDEFADSALSSRHSSSKKNGSEKSKKTVAKKLCQLPQIYSHHLCSRATGDGVLRRVLSEVCLLIDILCSGRCFSPHCK